MDQTTNDLAYEAQENKNNYLSACKTIADMHAAAVGEVRGPIRGVVEDVEDVRLRAERAEAAIIRVRERCQGVRDRVGPRGMINASQILNLLSPTWPDGNYESSGPVATEATEPEKTARVFAALHRSAEQDVTRVIALYEQWVKAGPPPLGTSMSRWWDARLVELHNAILPPDRCPAGCGATSQCPLHAPQPKEQ